MPRLIQITQDERKLLKKGQRKVNNLQQKTAILKVSERRTMVAIVVADVPVGVSEKDWTVYIEDAVGCMSKSYSPEDPLFDLDGDTVKACVMK